MNIKSRQKGKKENQLRVRFFKKIQDWILNPKESENVFCVSLLNRSIQDLSNHGASKEPKNPLWVDGIPYVDFRSDQDSTKRTISELSNSS